MVALQLRQTGQTNCGQHQVGRHKKRRKKTEKARNQKKNQLGFIFRERNTAVTSFYNQTTIDQAKICENNKQTKS